MSDVEEEEALEGLDPVRLCFDSKIFGSVVLAYCSVKELKTLRLVSRYFQATVKKELLSRTFITFDCIESYHDRFSGFLKLSDIVRFKFEDFAVLQNLEDVPKKVWRQMTNLKHLSIVNWSEPSHAFEWPRGVFKTISSLSIEGVVPSGELPETLEHLKFGDLWTEPSIKLPGSLTHLRFWESFNKPLAEIPRSLTHLTFGRDFDQPIDHLPDSLTHLKLGFYFDKSIDGLSDCIVNLWLGYSFNQPLKRLPRHLSHLRFGDKFNRVVSHLLPKSLTHLEFGSQFTESLRSLPASLTHLALCGSAYLSIPEESAKLVLRDSLKHLSIRGCFAKSSKTDRSGLYKHFPKSVEHVVVTGAFAHDLSPLSRLKHLNNLEIVVEDTGDIDDLTDGVVEEEGLETLPDSIAHLSLKGAFDQPAIRLPCFLTHLTFGNRFNRPIEALPKTPLHQQPLYSGGFCGQKGVLLLPNGLVYLKLGTDFNQSVDKLPDSVKHLFFGEQFDRKVDRLPRSLVTLEFGENFDRPVDKLPPSVEKIVFGDNFNRTVDKLPNKVEDLTFGINFDQPLSNLPKSVVRVSCYSSSMMRFVTDYPSTEGRQTTTQKRKPKTKRKERS